MSSDMDSQLVWEIIRGHKSFKDPFSQAANYCIFDLDDEDIDEAAKKLYGDKLRYAVKNAGELIQRAFRVEFFDFAGVDKEAVHSPEEMRDGLIFDSFVLDRKNDWVGACLTNDHFMLGHFIECWWDSDWNVVSWCIC